MYYVSILFCSGRVRSVGCSLPPHPQLGPSDLAVCIICRFFFQSNLTKLGYPLDMYIQRGPEGRAEDAGEASILHF